MFILQGIGESQQQGSATLEAIEWVGVGNLQAAGHGGNIELPEACTVDLAGLGRMGAEDTRLEHFQAGDGKPLAAAIDSARLLALVLPFCSGACVQEDRDQEEVD